MIASWVNHVHQVSWGLDKNCRFFTDGQLLNVSCFIFTQTLFLFIIEKYHDLKSWLFQLDHTYWARSWSPAQPPPFGTLPSSIRESCKEDTRHEDRCDVWPEWHLIKLQANSCKYAEKLYFWAYKTNFSVCLQRKSSIYDENSCGILWTSYKYDLL